MQVNSMLFLVFLAVSALVYLKTPQKYAPAVIAVCNIVFYLSGGAIYLPALLFVTVMSYGSAWYLAQCQQSSKKQPMFLLVTLLLSALLFFKYYNFFVSIVQGVCNALSLPCVLSPHSLIWPLGISFYTFTALGYVIDVATKKTQFQSNFLRHFAFVSFFPTVSSGPILRWDDFAKELHRPKTFDYDTVALGVSRMLFGFVKKLVIADNIGKMVDAIYLEPTAQPAPILLFGVALYALQIYCDFAGYSDIAIGAAKIMGFTVTENFKRPYLATNYSDFWTRWHISLTSWFKDYIFVPLSFTYRNLGYLAVFLIYPISGLWHGAGWNYIIWGVLNGIFVVVGKKTAKKRKKLQKKNPLYRSKLVKHVVQSAVVYALFAFTLIFFRLPTLGDAVCVLKGLFTGWGVLAQPTVLIAGLKSIGVGTVSGGLLVLYVALLLFSELQEEKHNATSAQLVRSMKPWQRMCIYYGLLLLFICFANTAASTYIYYQY